MSDAAQKAVRSLLLPLHGGSMLLPNAAVAEVVPYRTPRAVEGSEAWLLGHVPWRNQTVPLVSFEALGGAEPEAARRGAQLVVLNGLTAGDRLPYYAVLARAIPHLIQVAPDTIGELEDEPASELVLCHVAFGEQRAVIPNLDTLEARLLDALPA